MKVLMLNGSPHENGTTFRALSEIKNQLAKQNIDSDILFVGNLEVSGCKGCKACAKLGKCIKDDIVNKIAEMMKSYDGFIVGSPVHYASIGGTIKCILDRLFYSAGSNFAYKPACGVVAVRRAGSTSALEILNKYFAISNMPIVSSKYWNMLYGTSGEEAEQDLEGLQTMRGIAKNMAWLLKCIEAGNNADVPKPEPDAKIRTSFIR